MTRFRFRLERVLAWRRTQLEVAEARLEAQHRAVAALDSRSTSLQAAGIRAERAIRQWANLTGADLAALDAFRHGLRQRQGEAKAQLAAARGDLERLRTAMLDARRNCRLLERLRERRLAEWNSEAERELEQLAGEAANRRWRAEIADSGI